MSSVSEDVDVVILCGGRGLRYKEKTNTIPKPMVPIGGKPLLWHIMKSYSVFGFKRFILCLGYKGEIIKKYFKNQKDWDVICVDTGPNTNTGGRIYRVRDYISGDPFFATYGDGLSDIKLRDELTYHQKHGKIATMAVVQPPTHFGVLNIGSDNLVSSFIEKPKLEIWVNGGFFVFNKKIFDYSSPNSILELDTLPKLAEDRELVAYHHYNFWRCLDTYKDHIELNKIWKNGNAGWVVCRNSVNNVNE